MVPSHWSDPGNSPGLASVVQGNTQFALDLYRMQQAKPGNLFFSPYSISAALIMAYAGARGQTSTQMAQALHFDPDPEPLHPAFAELEAGLKEVGKKGAVQLSVANRLWPDRRFALLAEYRTLVQRFYGAGLNPVDYRDPQVARKTINAWAEEQTGHKITDLIPEGLLTGDTRLVLTNAIYFKGDWTRKFKPRLTQLEPFWITPAGQVQVQMMTQRGEFRYRESDDLQVLELPYAGQDLSMIVLLPGLPDGLAQLEDSLTAENLDRWTGGLYETEVQLFLPRFEVTFAVRLDKALASLGMADVFSPRADFSGMDGTRLLYIDTVLHKAFVVVNEEGAEAAAATAVLVRVLGMPQPAPVFRADHPFLFLIRENRTGSILFLGRVANPLQR